MLRTFIFTALAVMAYESDAQALRRNGLKADLAGVWQQRLGLAYERRVNGSSGFELQVSYTHHNSTSTSFFNGSYQVDYAWREVHMATAGNFNSLVSEDYLGNGRPMAQLPAGPIPLSTIQGSFAYRSSYGNTPQFRLFLQPSLQVMRHRFAEASDRTMILQKDNEQWMMGATMAEGTIKRQTTHFRQTRDMRVSNRWFGGVAYDIGLAYTLKNGLHLEGAVGLGINAGKAAYEKPNMPFTLNSVYTRYALRAGYFFGKVREEPAIGENMKI